jgi:NAD(P)H-hydrate epimerase
MEHVTTLDALAPRPADGHKGTFGTVLIIAGNATEDRMIGAPVLAAHGAMRAGAGLVRILAPQPIINAVLTSALFATGAPLPTNQIGTLDAQHALATFDRHCRDASAVVIGPGLGTCPAAHALVLRAIAQESTPVVLDADALNILAQHPQIWKDLRAPAILTPHPGEFLRIERALNLAQSPLDTDDQRMQRCASIAARLGALVVLKGARTVVSDGHRIWRSTHTHACLATGGTGDVLAGVIGGLVAAAARAGGPGLFTLAAIAVEAHARAAEAWAQLHGATAGLYALELPPLIATELEAFRSNASTRST